MPASSSPTCSGARGSTAWRREGGSEETEEKIDDVIGKTPLLHRSSESPTTPSSNSQIPPTTRMGCPPPGRSVFGLWNADTDHPRHSTAAGATPVVVCPALARRRRHGHPGLPWLAVVV